MNLFEYQTTMIFGISLFMLGFFIGVWVYQKIITEKRILVSLDDKKVGK